MGNAGIYRSNSRNYVPAITFRFFGSYHPSLLYRICKDRLFDPQLQLAAELYSVLDELYKNPSVTLTLQCLLPFAVVGRWFVVPPPSRPLFSKRFHVASYLVHSRS